MKLRTWRGTAPQLGERVFIDEAAVVIGDVVIGAYAVTGTVRRLDPPDPSTARFDTSGKRHFRTAKLPSENSEGRLSQLMALLAAFSSLVQLTLAVRGSGHMTSWRASWQTLVVVLVSPESRLTTPAFLRFSVIHQCVETSISPATCLLSTRTFPWSAMCAWAILTLVVVASARAF